MEYLILVLITFLFVRYGIKILDTSTEFININITEKINDVNIEIAKKSEEFEKSCEKPETVVRGFHLDDDFEEELDEDELDEEDWNNDDDDEDNGDGWVN